jgi:hypothetical protein
MPARADAADRESMTVDDEAGGAVTGSGASASPDEPGDDGVGIGAESAGALCDVESFVAGGGVVGAIGTDGGGTVDGADGTVDASALEATEPGESIVGSVGAALDTTPLDASIVGSGGG